MSRNFVYLIGNVGGDPEHHRKSETSPGVVSFMLAENVAKFDPKTKQYERAHTNWFPIRVFGALADRVKANIKKGDRVLVSGKLRSFQYEDNHGHKTYGFEILADSVMRSGILPKAGKQSPDADDPGNFDDFNYSGVSQ